MSNSVAPPGQHGTRGGATIKKKLVNTTLEFSHNAVDPSPTIQEIKEACVLINTRVILLSLPSLCFLSAAFLYFWPVMEPSPEDHEEQRLDRVDSLPCTELASTSSDAFSSVFSELDSRSSTVSVISVSSGEIPAAVVEEATMSPVEEVPSPVTVKEKCVGRNSKGVSWGFTSVIGRRSEMEDTVAVIPGFVSRTCDHVGGCTAPGSKTSGEISPVHFFGVYDGHGGSQVANYCKERMHEVIAEELNRETVDGSEWRRRWEAAFSSGFERTDNELLTEATEMVGSTAVVAVVSGCQIIISNCGDSRAVLCRGTGIVPLTVDQKPDREDELMRIEGGGGKVINWNGARVFGVLAMSRAIGDHYLRPWIIPVPEITFTTRSDEDECLILASDGLWDVMSNEEVGDMARRLLRRWRRTIASTEIPPAQAVADNLTEIAYSRNSSDNISIIVVDLKPKKKRHRKPSWQD
ncbi:protein phosphatase 2C 56-like [Mercurialis annua]|uniref:protein phosphatase 2C 56-like n=1 Tax=Mercurialis annua TaxID=3986 RepID=UPI00215E5A43|nr:protein phosphatase 2C 56-like [Mercurialis annua]